MKDDEKTELMALAGDCVNCQHYNTEGVYFEMECIECKRFYSDKFQKRAMMTGKESDMEKRMSTLSNWIVVKNPGGWCNLRGRVLNDNRFDDGTVVHTSMLISIDFVAMTAETKNTIYRLV